MVCHMFAIVPSASCFQLSRTHTQTLRVFWWGGERPSTRDLVLLFSDYFVRINFVTRNVEFVFEYSEIYMYV